MSLQRLDKYLWSNELEKDAIVELPLSTTTPAVRVEGASFKWEPDAESPTLTNINLYAKRGALITVVGRVGSGKSSLLASLLGEMPKITGKVIHCCRTCHEWLLLVVYCLKSRSQYLVLPQVLSFFRLMNRMA